MLTGLGLIVASQLIPQLVPHKVAVRHWLELRQLIYDGVHFFLERLFQVAVHLFAGDGLQLLRQLRHHLFDGRTVAEVTFHLSDQLPHYLLCFFRYLLVGDILFLVQCVELVLENLIGERRTHGGDPIWVQVALLGIIAPDHHVDMRMVTFIVESGVPMEAACWDLHGFRYLLLLGKNEPPPLSGAVIAEPGGILPAQGIDECPDPAVMTVQFLYRCRKGYRVTVAEQPVFTLTLHTRTGGDVLHVAVRILNRVGVGVQRHGDECGSIAEGGSCQIVLVLEQLLCIREVAEQFF